MLQKNSFMLDWRYGRPGAQNWKNMNDLEFVLKAVLLSVQMRNRVLNQSTRALREIYVSNSTGKVLNMVMLLNSIYFKVYQTRTKKVRPPKIRAFAKLFHKILLILKFVN